MYRTASLDIANNPPTASIGLEPRPSEMPVDHRSGPLPRAVGRSFRDGDRRYCLRALDVSGQCDPCAVHLVDRLPSEVREVLHALCDAGGPRRLAFGLHPSAGLHRQRSTDTCHLGLDKLVAPEPPGKANTFIADFVSSREGTVNFSDVDVSGICDAPASPARVLVSSSSPATQC